MAESRKERVVKIRMFDYTGEDGLPAFGRRGDKILVTEEDEKRGERLDVFEAEEDARAAGSDQGAPEGQQEVDAAAMSDDELIEFVNADGSTIPRLVSLAKDDPELAERLIVAEEQSGRQGGPRSTLVDKLQAIVDDATS